VLFTVSDNGPGIPPEYHDLIFRKFGQVEMPRSPRTRSSGLGLTFCKLVVERHGGRIWVKSAEGKGSSFYIELPSDPTLVEGQSAGAAAATTGWGSNR
jgi:signal transduction histidine kinase